MLVCRSCRSQELGRACLGTSEFIVFDDTRGLQDIVSNSCPLVGGTAARVSSQEEFDFVRALVLSLDRANDGFYIGKAFPQRCDI